MAYFSIDLGEASFRNFMLLVGRHISVGSVALLWPFLFALATLASATLAPATLATTHNG